jgi:ubiquinone/menaquinone biosynthesis C-methylase UbiE
MRYSPEPVDKQTYTLEFDRFYTRFAHLYDFLVKILPVWRRWICHVLPHVQGPRILEVSFGTGSLFDFYEQSVEICGVEYNREMIGIAKRNMSKRDRHISFQQADVNQLPFQSGVFDTVVNTMAFTGYPDGNAAMAEMNRVLRDGGKLVMVDVNYPRDGNRMGVQLARLWMRLGDILRDMDPIFRHGGFEYVDKEIGGWGSVHLYIATKVS